MHFRDCALALGAFMSLSTQATGQLGANLIENPSFEEYIVSSSGNMSVEGEGMAILAGWEVFGGILQLSRYDGTYPFRNPPQGGGDFALFGNSTQPSISQEIDLVQYQDAVMSGSVELTLSAFLGSFNFPNGFPIQRDRAEFAVTFFDTQGRVMSTATVFGPTDPDQAGLDVSEYGNYSAYREFRGPVPAEALQATVTVTFRQDFVPGFNNANVDLVGFVLDDATCDEDLDGSGAVELEDLLQLLAAFGQTCA